MNLFAYCVVPVFIALLIDKLKSNFAFFAFLMLVGTAIHELLHLIVGIFTFGRPNRFSIWPKKEGSSYVLGYVSFTNVRWYNAVFIGTAPLIGMLFFVFLAENQVTNGKPFGVSDLCVWYVMAMLLLSSWPSSADWKIASKSWPIVVLCALYLSYNPVFF